MGGDSQKEVTTIEQKHRNFLVLAIAVTVFLAVAVSFGLPAFTRDVPEVTLADVNQDASGQQSEGVLAVSVTPQTVQSVIATLSRPDSYYRELTVGLYWNHGTAGDENTVQIWADGGYLKTAITAQGTVQYRLVGDDRFCLWYSGDRIWKELPVQQAHGDLAQRIPTYEDVLALPLEQISEANYERKNGKDCIYVAVENTTLGSVDRYWIETATGLLCAAEMVEDGQVVYEMTETAFRTPLEAGVNFALPDGTVLHETSESVVSQEKSGGQGQ